MKLLRKLSGRIFFTFAAALLLLATIFGVFSARYGARLVVQSSANELRVLSVVLSELIQSQFSSLEESLTKISEKEELVHALKTPTSNRRGLENYLIESLSQSSQLTDLMIYDLKGECIASTDPDWYKIKGKSWKFFQLGLEGFNFPSIYGTDAMGRVQLVSAPIYDEESSVVGVIVAILDLHDIYKIMDQKIGLNDTTDAFLLDPYLRFITAGRSGEKGLVESHLASTKLSAHLNDELWVGEYMGAKGINVLGTALKIPGHSWYIVVERDYDETLRQVTALNQAVLATTVTLMLVFILASLGLSRSITKPLSRLVSSARQIQAGNYNEPVQVGESIEEVSAIAKELERLRQEVRSAQNRLKEKLSISEQSRIENERLAAIGSLAASLAHEIRNPLNAMSLLLSRLQYHRSEEVKHTVIQDLFGEVSRLDRLVATILDYARPVKLIQQRVQFSELAGSVLCLFQNLADQQFSKIGMSGDSNIFIECDSDGIKQSLMNLVKNALEAVSSGGEVSMEWQKKGDELEISVSDNGHGILKGAEEKLFSPFFTTKENGTGLGLSSVHKIVSAHGGRIFAENILNTDGETVIGARFVMMLPLSDAVF